MLSGLWGHGRHRIWNPENEACSWITGSVAVVPGTMIRSGMFMSPQFVLAYIESPEASLLIWALAGLVAMFAVLSYTKLWTIISKSGEQSHLSWLWNLLVLLQLALHVISTASSEVCFSCDHTGCWNSQHLECLNPSGLLGSQSGGVNTHWGWRDSGGYIEQHCHCTFKGTFKGAQYSLITLEMAFIEVFWSYTDWYNLNISPEELRRQWETVRSSVVHVCLSEYIIALSSNATFPIVTWQVCMCVVNIKIYCNKQHLKDHAILLSIRQVSWKVF